MRTHLNPDQRAEREKLSDALSQESHPNDIEVNGDDIMSRTQVTKAAQNAKLPPGSQGSPRKREREQDNKSGSAGSYEDNRFV